MGKYADKNLASSEMVIFETHHHWSFYLTFSSLLTFGIWPYLHTKCTEFVMTNRRIILKTGVFSLQSFEMHLSKIENIQIEQTFSGKLFNYGNVIIVGTGGSREKIEYITNPAGFRQCFIQIIN